MNQFIKMSIVWACCSSGRSDTIVGKTLTTLNDAGFIGTVFVCVPHDELVTYSNALKNYPVILVGAKKGMVNQRKHIRDMWPPGQEIVFIADDVTRIKFLAGGRLHSLTNIHAAVEILFQYIHNMEGPLVWGVYPTINRDWLKTRESIGNVCISTALYGIVNDPRLTEPESDDCEDWARQLSEQAAGRAPVRFDWIGIQRDHLPERSRAACEALVAAYTDIVKLKIQKGTRIDLKPLRRPSYIGREILMTGPAVVDLSGS